MILNYWKIVCMMCDFSLEVTRLRSHFSFMYKLQQFELNFYFIASGLPFTMLSHVLIMNILGNPVGLGVSQTQSKICFPGFCSASPLSLSCYFKESHWLPSACCSVSHVVSPPTRDTCRHDKGRMQLQLATRRYQRLGEMQGNSSNKKSETDY